MLESFHFLRPWWLLALIPIVFVFVWLLRHHAQQKTWQQVGDPVLMQHLLQDIGGKQRQYPRYLLLLGLVISIIALAGPAWEQLKTPLFTKSDALVVVVALSKDMDVTDLKPSRLVQVQQKLNDLLSDFRNEGQTALLVFAGDTHIVSPLTTDTQTILSLLPVLQTDLMPIKGYDVAQALEQAVVLLKNAGKQQGQVLLIAHDGGSEAALNQAKQLAQQGYQLSVLGVGTAQGAPIPDKVGLRKNAQGQILFSRRDDNSLQALANAGNGHYQTLRLDNQDLTQLLQPSKHDSDYQRDEQEHKQQQWADEGVYLLVLLIPLALLSFRRGWFVLLLTYMLPLAFLSQSQPSYAFSWQDLWTRSEQQAKQQFDQGQHQQAAEKFQDPAWKASAYYKAGEYDKAIEYYEQLDTAEAWYNKGNALAQSGKLEQASQAYAEALQRQTDFSDATNNKKIVDDLLDQQQQNQEEQQSQNQQNQDGQQSQEQQNQEGQQSQEQQNQEGQQSQDQQNQDGQQSQEQQSQEGQQSQEQQNQEEQQSETKQQTAQTNENEESQSALSEQETEASETDSETPSVLSTLNEEDQQAVEIFLQQIPDDPANLLRRKFYLNSQRRQQQ